MSDKIKGAVYYDDPRDLTKGRESAGEEESVYKWFWMADYCKKNEMPAHQKWAWDKAELAFKEAHELNPNINKQ